MNIRGERIKCVSNFQAPELVIGKVYTAGGTRTNTHGIWQVEVEGKWYAHSRFVLAKEKEVVKQQFYVGDVVEVVKTEAENWYKIGDKFVVSGWNDGEGALSSEPPHVTIEGEGKYAWVMAKNLKILSRAWQKNTGKQPVEDGVVVQIKRIIQGTPVCYTGRAESYGWCNSDIVEWRLADSVSSIEDQPEDSVPPSHVALGEELVTTNVQQDLVNSPKHYAFFDGVEAIEIIASSMSVEAFRGYCMGNALKYRLRVGKKDKMEQEIAKADKYGELFEKHKHLCKG